MISDLKDEGLEGKKNELFEEIVIQTKKR